MLVNASIMANCETISQDLVNLKQLAQGSGYQAAFNTELARPNETEVNLFW
jgi:hypothetical protein